MNILQLGKYFPPLPGGIERHVKDLCTALHENNITPYCILSSQWPIGSFTRENNIPVLRVGKLLPRMPPLNPTLPFHVSRLAKTSDLVHVHVPNPSAELSALIARPKKLIVTYHADITHKPYARPWLPFQKMLLRKADAIIVTSQNYLDSSPVLREFRHKCVVIPLSSNPERFSTPNNERVAKIQELGKPPYFLFVGRLVKYKGLPYLLEAMRLVQGTLFIVGQGPLSRTLKQHVIRAGLQKRVHFFTSIPDNDLVNFYHAADAFVLPSISRAEAFGIVQLEAMAAGKPVISTKLGTGVEFVNQHNKTGFVVLPKNSHALATAMNTLAQNPALRKRMGGAGKKRANEFTPQILAKKTILLYQQVLGKQVSRTVLGS